MSIKIKAKVDERQLKAALADFQKLFQKNLVTVIHDMAIPELISMIMKGFDDLSQKADMLPKDPTNPSNWRMEFEQRLYEDVANTFIVAGNKIIVRLGDKDFLGYDPSGQKNDKHDSQPLVWMVYYLEGLVGEWAFIDRDTYLRKRKRELSLSAGRFGEGFMISKQRFFKEGWNKVVNFQEVRHPFSGFSPVDIFLEAIQEFRFRPYVLKAIQATAAGRLL